MKIANVFLESTVRQLHIYGVFKKTGFSVPEESVRTALKDMEKNGWLTAESSSCRVFYSMTEKGSKGAMEELKPLQSKRLNTTPPST
jgi:DNA-binding transcriptional regulator PaaX